MSKKYSVSLLKAIILMAALVSVSSCDTIIDTISELPEEVPARDNPSDPGSPDYFRLPELRLNNGSFEEVFVIDQNSIEISWEPDEYVNGLQYRYKYAGPTEDFESKEWSFPQSEAYVLIPDLKETFNNESYRFAVEVSSSQRSDITPKVFEGSFIVNASHEKGFLFRPDVVELNNNNSFTVEIFIDEIHEMDDLTALSLVIEYDSNELDVWQEGIIVNDPNNFFYGNNGEVIAFTKIENGTVTIDLGVAGNNLAPLSGGGKICEITFHPRYLFESSSIFVSTASVLKTSLGYDIPISNFTNAILVQ